MFSGEIMNNATNESIKHLIDLKSNLILYAHDGALMCKLFLATLLKEGFKWFTDLKLKYVTLWKQL